MCLKPLPPRPIPEATVVLAKMHFDEDSVYQFIGDVLFEQFRDEDFADLYPKDGQPSLSPVLLSFLLIFQSLEDLSDRQTVYQLRIRNDWMYALHRSADQRSFDHTVLVEFRQRLLKHEVESRVFSTIFGQLKQLGFYKRRGVQRTDSLPIFSHCRELHRIELTVETLRTTICDLLHKDKEWAQTHLPEEWEKRYAAPCKSDRMKETARQELAVIVGDDGQWLLHRLEQEDAEHLRERSSVEALRAVWATHYIRGADGHIQWTENGERGSAETIETPHDPDARWATKRSTDWIGYKLQVTETDDADYPHLITDIALTPALESDMLALDAIHERQAALDALPSERYVDSGYVSGGNSLASEKLGEDLIGPIRDTSTPQSRLPDGFTHDDFRIDFEARTVTCPNDQVATMKNAGKEGIQAIFPRDVCEACPLRERCCTGKKNGRTLRFGPDYQTTQAVRKRQQTAEFKEKYRAHRGGVEGCLSSLVRGQGIRTTRYRGKRKNNLRALFVAAAVNLARSSAWRAGKRPTKRVPRLGLRPNHQQIEARAA